MYGGGIFLVCVPTLVLANYRDFGFYNHDLCKSGEDGKSLKLGKSAALLTLDTSVHSDRHKCSIKLQTDKGFGLMVYIEDMYLQQHGLRCKEYVQFGRDDILPFITLNKSKKLCGNRTGAIYDEPDGKLLIWLNLSSQKYSESKPKKLSIVITPYIDAKDAQESTDYRLCQSGDRAIRKVYFCDDRVNCALDRGVPGDERPEICRHVPGRGGGKVDVDQPPMWAPPLNLVSITLVLVSGVVVLVIVLLLVSRLRRSGLCCYKDRRGSCELPEGITSNNRAAHGNAGSGGASALITRDRGGAGDRTWDNQLLPLTYLPEGRQERGARPRPGRGTTPVDSEPPPAYHDLFPPGYKYDPDKVNAILETNLSNDLMDASVKPDEASAAIDGDTARPEHDQGLVDSREGQVSGRSEDRESRTAENHTLGESADSRGQEIKHLVPQSTGQSSSD